MERQVIRHIQSNLVEAGLLTNRPGPDGIWGPASEDAFQRLLMQAGVLSEKDYDIGWSSKVTPAFVEKVKDIANRLRLPLQGADDLMACMAWESGETFSPSIRNRAGSGATGLIQFMPLTALSFFYSPEAIAKMTPDTQRQKGKHATDTLAALSAEEQLDYVYRYFLPYAGRLHNLGDIYMAILWPAAIEKPDTYVLWDKKKNTTHYKQNAGLDLNHDGIITKGECVSNVKALQRKGQLLCYRRRLS